MENFQEGVQVYLKETPPQIFPKVAGKFPEKIGAAYENSNIFYKIFYANAETSNSPFRSHTLMKSCYSKTYTKIHGPQPSRPHTFSHEINTSGVKIRLAFKKLMILIS